MRVNMEKTIVLMPTETFSVCTNGITKIIFKTIPAIAKTTTTGIQNLVVLHTHRSTEEVNTHTEEVDNLSEDLIELLIHPLVHMGIVTTNSWLT